MKTTLEVFKADNTVGVLFVPIVEEEKANNLAASLIECLGIPHGRMAVRELIGNPRSNQEKGDNTHQGELS